MVENAVKDSMGICPSLFNFTHKELIDTQIRNLFVEYPDHETEINELFFLFEEKAGINEDFILNKNEYTEDNKKDFSDMAYQITSKTSAITVLYILKDIKQSDIPERDKVKLEQDIYLYAERTKRELEYERTKSRIEINKTIKQIEDSTKKDTEIFPVCLFPHEVIPQKIKEMCEDLSEVYQVDIEAVYTIMLPIISGSIGNSIQVYAKREWVQPVFLQNVLIEYSGRGKSPVQRFLMKTIYEQQDTEFQKYKEAMKQYKIDCKTAKDNGEPEPDKPICKRYTSNNTTVEALVNIQKDNQRGLILDIDEFSGHVKSHNQYKGKGNDKEYWLTSFNNAPYIVDRKGHEPINCKYTGMSIVAGIQPSELKRLFSSEGYFDTGYVARYNFYLHSDKAKKYKNHDKDIRNKQVWIDLIDYCHELEVINEDNSIVPTAIHFSQEAKEPFIDYINSLESCYRYLSDNGKPFIGKTQIYFSRFVGIIHILDCFFNKKEILSDISKETALNAQKLCEFYLSQAMRMLELYQDKEELSGQDKKLIEALKEVESEVKEGKVLLNSVVKAYNFDLKGNKAMSSMLKKFKLDVVIGAGNKSCLLWDSHKIEKLINKLS